MRNLFHASVVACIAVLLHLGVNAAPIELTSSVRPMPQQPTLSRSSLSAETSELNRRGIWEDIVEEAEREYGPIVRENLGLGLLQQDGLLIEPQLNAHSLTLSDATASDISRAQHSADPGSSSGSKRKLSSLSTSESLDHGKPPAKQPRRIIPDAEHQRALESTDPTARRLARQREYERRKAAPENAELRFVRRAKRLSGKVGLTEADFELYQSRDKAKLALLRRRSQERIEGMRRKLQDAATRRDASEADWKAKLDAELAAREAVALIGGTNPIMSPHQGVQWYIEELNSIRAEPLSKPTLELIDEARQVAQSTLQKLEAKAVGTTQ